MGPPHILSLHKGEIKSQHRSSLPHATHLTLTTPLSPPLRLLPHTHNSSLPRAAHLTPASSLALPWLPQLPLDQILAFLKDPTWLKAAVVRHPIPRLLAAYFRQRDLNSKSVPEPTEDQYLFLDHATRKKEDGAALAGDAAAFAAYVDDVRVRLAGMSRITDLPWDLRYQVSFCGFRAHHVMYDHIAR